MNINFVVSQQGTFTGYWVANLYDPTALSTVLQTINIPMPFTGSQTASFTNVANQAYIVRQFLSNTTNWQDGTQLGADVQIQAGVTTSSVIRADLWLIAGQTTGMTPGNTTYTDTSLVDWAYSISMPGLADLQPGVDYNVISTGGFELINGNTFQNGEKYVIHFQPNITANSGGGGGGGTFTNANGKIFSGDLVVTNNITLQPTDIGKSIVISGTNTTITITLPEVSTIPDDVMTCFISEGGNHIMATIYASAGIQWQKRLSNNIYMAQAEELWLYKHGSVWRVAHADGNFKTVGTIFDCYQQDQINAIPLDGNYYSRALYPRLWEYIQNQLDSSLLVTDGVWLTQNTITGPAGSVNIYPNIGKFSTGDLSTTFRVPLICKAKDSNGNLISSGFTRGIGLPHLPFTGVANDLSIGRNEKDMVGNFYTDITGKTIWKSGTGNSIIALGIPASGPPTPDPDKSSGGNNIVTGVPMIGKNSGVAGASPNGETAPMNIGIYKMMLY